MLLKYKDYSFQSDMKNFYENFQMVFEKIELDHLNENILKNLKNLNLSDLKGQALNLLNYATGVLQSGGLVDDIFNKFKKIKGGLAKGPFAKLAQAYQEVYMELMNKLPSTTLKVIEPNLLKINKIMKKHGVTIITRETLIDQLKDKETKANKAAAAERRSKKAKRENIEAEEKKSQGRE